MRAPGCPAAPVRLGAILIVAALAGCARAPDLDTGLALGGTGTYPQMKPLADLAAPAGEATLAKEDAAALRARAAALERRGAALAGTTATDAATQARLKAALDADGG